MTAYKPIQSTWRKPEADDRPCGLCDGNGVRPREGAFYTCRRCVGTGVERVS